jgi:hypothetical protein
LLLFGPIKERLHGCILGSGEEHIEVMQGILADTALDALKAIFGEWMGWRSFSDGFISIVDTSCELMAIS